MPVDLGPWEHDPECRLWLALRDNPALLETIASSRDNELALQDRLRSRYPAELVRAALELVALRRRAVAKFSRAQEMWFDRRGLEQATAEFVAIHKAQRFAAHVAHESVWDLCCGIGGDSIGLGSSTAGELRMVDQQPVATLRACWNALAYGVSVERLVPVHRRVQDLLPDLRGAWVHLDPDRRPTGGPRMHRLAEHDPPYSWMRTLIDTARGGALKLGPASRLSGQFPACEIELISLFGECREATVWFGELRSTASWRATVLPAGVSITGHPLQTRAPQSTLQAYIYDPDPAVVRAGLVDVLAEQLGLCRLDPAEEYLTSDRLVHSAFLQTFEVLREVPADARHYRDAVRAAAWGQVEIKCRHLPIPVEQVRRRLDLTGTEAGVLLFVRNAGKSRAVLARRLAPNVAPEGSRDVPPHLCSR
ncbi:MAG: hypothetical protein KatS3mg114_1056 [Planctomycetaceae bacterium]|nr:MAG: hypothetical protein KatS3mg114_1056 [Planctomycetaceae bacterium]